MPSAISGYITQIQNAVYGEQVRTAIVNALEACYSDVENPDLQSAAFQEAIEAAYQSGILDIIEVTQVSQMTNENIIYRYMGTETGYTANTLYYYDGTAWAPIGGEYELPKVTLPVHGFAMGDYPSESNKRCFVALIPLKSGDKVVTSDASHLVYLKGYNSSGTQVATVSWTTEATVSVDANYAINFRLDPEVVNPEVCNIANESVSIIASSGSTGYEIDNIFKDKEIEYNQLPISSLDIGYLASDGSITIDNRSIVADERTSEYIEINENKSYTCELVYPNDPTYPAADTTDGAWATPWLAWCWFDEDKEIIGTRQGGGTSFYYDKYNNKIVKTLLTPPTDAKYIKVSFRTYKNCFPSLVEGKTEQPYFPTLEEYKNLSKIQTLPSPITIKHPFKSVCHRGYVENGIPENTIPAFKNAKKHGFNFCETDVWETTDGELVLFHNATITIDGTSKRVDACTYAELQTVDLGTGDYSGTKIPKLEEFISLCSLINLYPYIEIKGTLTENAYKKLVDTCQKYNMLRFATWISFGDNHLRGITRYDRQARLGWLQQNSSSADKLQQFQRLQNGVNEVFCDHSVWSESDVQLFASYGIGYEVWTIDSASTIQSLPGGICGVTSNTLIAENILTDYYTETV